MQIVFKFSKVFLLKISFINNSPFGLSKYGNNIILKKNLKRYLVKVRLSNDGNFSWINSYIILNKHMIELGTLFLLSNIFSIISFIKFTTIVK